MDQVLNYRRMIDKNTLKKWKLFEIAWENGSNKTRCFFKHSIMCNTLK